MVGSRFSADSSLVLLLELANSLEACSVSHPQLPCPGTHVTVLMGL